MITVISNIWLQLYQIYDYSYIKYMIAVISNIWLQLYQIYDYSYIKYMITVISNNPSYEKCSQVCKERCSK